MQNPLHLLRTERFWPLFWTQFFGAFNDNLFKNALVILITYQMTAKLNVSVNLVVTIAAGLFILPYFLFSPLAGQLSDKFEKASLIRYTKLFEIAIMTLGAVGFYLESVNFLLAVLFLLGTQATFFGPMKYAILPDHLRRDELITGNAYLEAGTYFAILLGMMLGGILAGFKVAPYLIVFFTILFAVIGYVSSRYIPPAGPAEPTLRINYNFVSETWNLMRNTFENYDLFLAIMGISWFWLVGATYMAQLPTYTKFTLGATEGVLTIFLMSFTTGIAIGSFLCNRLLKGRVNATYVPIAALFMSLFAIDLVFASRHLLNHGDVLLSPLSFLSTFSGWRLLLDFTLLAVSGGVYIVPLYTILQYESNEASRSRVIACNNIVNALFMVISAVVSALMLILHFSITDIFFLLAIANVLVAVYICQLWPKELLRSCFITILKVFYRIDVKGMEHYYAAGERVVIVSNHVSLIDGLILAVIFPHRLTIAIDTMMAEKGVIKHIIKLVDAIKIDPMRPMSLKALIERARSNHRIVIFPEGRLTVTGALMKIYEGPGMIADKAGARILPVRIEGAHLSPFSYLRGKVRIRWFPKIRVTILEPRYFDVPKDIKGRERRKRISSKLYDMMTDMMYSTSNMDETLYLSLLNAARIHGKKHVVLEDIAQKPLNYRKLILGSIILGRRMTKQTAFGDYLGLLLPNSVGSVVAFFGVQAFHRVPAMLNFSAGIQNVLLACRIANIKRVFTSSKFVELARLDNMIAALKEESIQVVFLEDVKESINIFEKVLGLVFSFFAESYYRLVNGFKESHDSETVKLPAVALFTSGSEGTPKGVVLSHRNLQANRYQLSARIDFTRADVILNAMPMFHAFGLNCGTLLPVISGMRVFMYPSPLHYRIVPSIAYGINATVLFGTNTFLAGYAKYAHPYDFYSMRYVFAGAEKLQSDTVKIWQDKFGIRILEGYGATELAPVISINTPMECKPGSVGRLLPAMQARLEPVAGITEGGRLHVSGPNVMLGYLRADMPGVIQPLEEGWHDTGDIVSFDESGFITILGRAKRFAKIAGEMISLTAIEEALYRLWPRDQHAILAFPDVRKGERLLLVTTHQAAERPVIQRFFKEQGMSDLAVPAGLHVMPDKLPVLGSGKIDYQALLHIPNLQMTVY